MRAALALRCLSLPLFVLGVAPSPATAVTPAAPDDLCVVRVEDTAPEHWVEVDQPTRYISAVRSFPNSPLVLAAPANRPGTWEITEDRRYARVTEGGPPRDAAVRASWLWDYFAEEAHSGRALALGGRGVWKLPPGAGRFVPHRREQWAAVQPVDADGFAYVRAWRATALIGRTGLFLIRDDAPLEPIFGPDGEILTEVRRVASIPDRGALLVQMHNGSVALATGVAGPERIRWLFRYPSIVPDFLADAPSARPARSPGPTDFLLDALPQPQPDTFLVRSDRTAHRVVLPPTREPPEVTLVERQSAEFPYFRFRRLAPGTRDYLVHAHDSWALNLFFWPGLYRLDGSRFVPVPGGTGPTFGRGALFTELRSRNLLAIVPEHGPLSIYRDRSVAPIAGSDELLGRSLRLIRDLPGIGRIIVHSPRGIFDLSEDLNLLPVDVSGPAPSFPTVVEMPASGVAIFLSRQGIHLLGPRGGLLHLPQTRDLNADAAQRAYYLPSRREVLFAAPRNGLFLLLDRRLSGSGPCGDAGPG